MGRVPGWNKDYRGTCNTAGGELKMSNEIEKIRQGAIKKFGYSADTNVLLEYVFTGMEQAGYILPSTANREAVRYILDIKSGQRCGGTERCNQDIECNACLTDQILSLTQPKVLSEEKLTEIAEMIFNFHMDIDGIKGILEQVSCATIRGE